MNVDYLKECFEMDAATGSLKWRERPRWHFSSDHAHKSWASRFTAKSAGSVNSDGYLQVTIDRRTYKVHRIIIALTTGSWPLGQVDHIDGDRLNNNPINLRDVGPQENRRNSCIPVTNTSGHVGVYKETYSNRWYACIGTGGRIKRLGTFATKDEAITARREAETVFVYSPTHGRSA